MEQIERLHPPVVILGSSTNRYVNESSYSLQVPGEPVATTPDAKLVAWGTGLRRTVGALADLGIQSVVVHPVPKYPGWDLRGCAAGHVVFDEFACGASMSRRTAEDQSADIDRSEDAAVAGVPRARAVGFIPQVCAPAICATDLRGVWLYTDGDHLSVTGALRLTPRFTRILQDALDDD
jgi:hypothetical protein